MCVGDVVGGVIAVIEGANTGTIDKGVESKSLTLSGSQKGNSVLSQTKNFNM